MALSAVSRWFIGRPVSANVMNMTEQYESEVTCWHSGMHKEGRGENYRMRSLMISTPHPNIIRVTNREECDGRGK
jgi:hypothetical protein